MNRISAFGSLLGALLLSTAIAAPDESKGIPKLASHEFGWQHNVEDWEEPPEGSGHGPIRNDPVTLTKRVPHGNPAPRRWAISIPSPCRATPPRALPNAIRT